MPTSTETVSPWKLESSWAENGSVKVPKPKSRPKAAASGVEVKAPAGKRRRFTPAEKLRIVRAANECVEHGSLETVYSMIERGELEHVRVSNAIRVVVRLFP